MLKSLHLAARRLLRTPWFSLTAIMIIATGVAATVTMFTTVESLILRPLPLPHPEELVRLYENQKPAFTEGSVSYPNFADWRKKSVSFQALAISNRKEFSLRDKNGDERISGAEVSSNYLSLLGAHFIWGRNFSDRETEPGSSRVVIINESLFRKISPQNAPDSNPTILLDGETYQVVGVVSSNFEFPRGDIGVWIPFTVTNDRFHSRGDHAYDVVGRLRPAIKLSNAQREMDVIASNLAKAYPDYQSDRGITLVSLHQDLVGSIAPTLWVLQIGTLCLLLMMSLNLANLLLSRAISRQKEIALYAVLGASRKFMVIDLLGESLVLGIAGSILGSSIAFNSIQFVRLWAKEYYSKLPNISVDSTTLYFSIVLSLLVSVGCGIGPAFSLIFGRRNKSFLTALQSSSYGSSGSARQSRIRNLSIVVQISVAFALLNSALLLLQSLKAVMENESGIVNPQSCLTANISLPGSKYSNPSLVSHFYSKAQEAIKHLPGVEFAGAITRIPFAAGGHNTDLIIQGRAPFPAQLQPIIECRGVIGDYFRCGGIPLIEGRMLDFRDAANTEKVILINEITAKRYWKTSRDALGEHLIFFGSPVTIVGVVGNVREFGLDRQPPLEMYFPVTQAPWLDEDHISEAQSMVFVIKAKEKISPMDLFPVIQKTVSTLDPHLILYAPKPWSKIINESIDNRILDAGIIGGIAFMGLLIASFGLYAIVAYSVTQQRREIGIRITLGAQAKHIFGSIMKQSAYVTSLGIAIGILAVIILAPSIQQFLYNTSGFNLNTALIISLIFILVSIVANLIPTTKLLRLNPLENIKERH